MIMYDTIFVTSFTSRVDFHRLFFIFIKPNLGLVMAGQEGRLLNNRLECRFSRDNDPSVKDPNDPELDSLRVEWNQIQFTYSQRTLCVWYLLST